MKSPLVRALLNEVALDNQEHSALLKAVAKAFTFKNRLERMRKTRYDASKILKLQKETAKMQEISLEDLLNPDCVFFRNCFLLSVSTSAAFKPAFCDLQKVYKKSKRSYFTWILLGF